MQFALISALKSISVSGSGMSVSLLLLSHFPEQLYISILTIPQHLEHLLCRPSLNKLICTSHPCHKLEYLFSSIYFAKHCSYYAQHRHYNEPSNTSGCGLCVCTHIFGQQHPAFVGHPNHLPLWDSGALCWPYLSEGSTSPLEAKVYKVGRVFLCPTFHWTLK